MHSVIFQWIPQTSPINWAVLCILLLATSFLFICLFTQNQNKGYFSNPLSIKSNNPIW